MRMLLTSNGVTNDSIRAALLELLGKPFSEARIAVVIDAILPFGGDSAQTFAHLGELRALGWEEFDLMSLFGGPRTVIEERLRGADVIFCYGGSNHWLAHVWTTTGLAPVLRELLDQKLYLGLSAGSMIFSRLHNRVIEAFEDQPELDMLELDSVDAAVPLFDWALQPHLGASFFPHATDAWAAESAARLAAPVYFVDDQTALLVRNAGEVPEVISEGHWLQFDDGGTLVASR